MVMQCAALPLQCVSPSGDLFPFMILLCHQKDKKRGFFSVKWEFSEKSLRIFIHYLNLKMKRAFILKSRMFYTHVSIIQSIFCGWIKSCLGFVSVSVEDLKQTSQNVPVSKQNIEGKGFECELIRHLVIKLYALLIWTVKNVRLSGCLMSKRQKNIFWHSSFCGFVHLLLLS